MRYLRVTFYHSITNRHFDVAGVCNDSHPIEQAWDLLANTLGVEKIDFLGGAFFISKYVVYNETIFTQEKLFVLGEQ